VIESSSFLTDLDADSEVVTLTLNRPERLNARTFEVDDELCSMFERLKMEPGVRAILLTGAGKAFCSGGDVQADEAHMNLATAIEAEAQIQAALMRRPDFTVAFTAFQEKRPARFL